MLLPRQCRSVSWAFSSSSLRAGSSFKLGSRARLRMPACSASKRLIAFDFDGVVCDSVGESSISAFKAAAEKWPEIFATEAAEAVKPQLLEGMRAVRPVVETGYENIVQIRCLYEGISPQQILDEWHTLLPAKMKEWALDRKELVHLFGSVRDRWMEEDLEGWLAPNNIYPRVGPLIQELLDKGSDEVYIVTTKQAHYTSALLSQKAGVTFDDSRIHSTTLSGEPKAHVLARLVEEHPDALGFIFIEDKMGTLEKVVADPTASAWQLLLVDWGYNTQAERQAAAAHPRVQLVNLDQLHDILLPLSK